MKDTGKWLLSRIDTRILRWTLELNVLILDVCCFLICITNHHKLSAYNNTNSWSGNFVNDRSLSWTILTRGKSHRTDVKSEVWHVCSNRDIAVIGRVISHVSIVPWPHWLVTEVSWLDCLLLKAGKKASSHSHASDFFDIPATLAQRKLPALDSLCNQTVCAWVI